jgi:hypothetical protein
MRAITARRFRFLASLATAPLVAAVAHANVLPDPVFRLHVQDEIGPPCLDNPVQTCWDVDRVSEAEGALVVRVGVGDVLRRRHDLR